MPLIKCMAFSPFRPTDWRWQRALALQAAGCRLGRYDDPPVRAALAFIRQLAAATTNRQRAALQHRSPALHAAHQLYIAAGVQRDEVEARLLAGQPLPIIAAKVGIDAEVLQAYETFFYNVTAARAHGAMDWLLIHAGLPLPPAPRPTEGQAWRWAALAAGPFAVDVLVADHLGQVEPQLPDRHDLAEKFRLLAEDHAAGPGWGPGTPALIDRLCQTFREPLRRAIHEEGDRMLAAHIRFLRLVACLPPLKDLELKPPRRPRPRRARSASSPLSLKEFSYA